MLIISKTVQDRADHENRAFEKLIENVNYDGYNVCEKYLFFKI